MNFSGNVHPALVTQAMLLALIALDFGERNLLPISDPEKWEPLTAATLWEKQWCVSGN